MVSVDEVLFSQAYGLYRGILFGASPEIVEEGKNWYPEAKLVAQRVADMLCERGHSVSVRDAAAIVSAFSPRTRWQANIVNVVSWAAGSKPATMKMCLDLANNALAAANNGEDAVDTLNGPKTNAFARNIDGEHDPVTIDSWMMKLAGQKASTPNKTQYHTLSEVIRRLAAEFGCTNREAQAVIWCAARGTGK